MTQKMDQTVSEVNRQTTVADGLDRLFNQIEERFCAKGDDEVDTLAKTIMGHFVQNKKKLANALLANTEFEGKIRVVSDESVKLDSQADTETRKEPGTSTPANPNL